MSVAIENELSGLEINNLSSSRRASVSKRQPFTPPASWSSLSHKPTTDSSFSYASLIQSNPRKSAKQLSLLSLPPEIINHIISLSASTQRFYPARLETLRSCSLVCKEWTLFSQQSLWGYICMPSKPRIFKMIRSPSRGMFNSEHVVIGVGRTTVGTLYGGKSKTKGMYDGCFLAEEGEAAEYLDVMKILTGVKKLEVMTLETKDLGFLSYPGMQKLEHFAFSSPYLSLTGLDKPPMPLCTTLKTFSFASFLSVSLEDPVTSAQTLASFLLASENTLTSLSLTIHNWTSLPNSEQSIILSALKSLAPHLRDWELTNLDMLPILSDLGKYADLKDVSFNWFKGWADEICFPESVKNVTLHPDLGGLARIGLSKVLIEALEAGNLKNLMRITRGRPREPMENEPFFAQYETVMKGLGGACQTRNIQLVIGGNVIPSNAGIGRW